MQHVRALSLHFITCPKETIVCSSMIHYTKTCGECDSDGPTCGLDKDVFVWVFFTGNLKAFLQKCADSLS